MDYNEILKLIHEKVTPLLGKGQVANYIPELAQVAPGQLGMALVRLDGKVYTAGAAQTPFSIQSISKVFSLAMAMSLVGEELWKRVGVEPSGDPFDSLISLEREKGIPRNPFINAGALVVIDVLLEHLGDLLPAVLSALKQLINEEVKVNYSVALSEAEYGYRNRALVNYMKSFGNIHSDVDTLLNAYFHNCAIEMNCVQLARAFLLFANHGVVPYSGDKLLSKSQTKRINAIMQTCGFYDEAGEFAFKVGLPGKSGVGGGIVAVLPGEYSVAVWSPELNEHGNSLAGIAALEMLTTISERSVF